MSNTKRETGPIQHFTGPLIHLILQALGGRALAKTADPGKLRRRYGGLYDGWT